MKNNNIKNFHTHTQLCHHAVGMPKDYVRQAEQDGCTALGFSDHCPYPSSFRDKAWQHIRMSEEDIPYYRQAVQEAAADTDMPIYIGYECEWDKDFENWYRDGLKGKYEAQYLVLGPHWVTLGNSHTYACNIHDVPTLYKYIDQLIEGMQSGIFDFVAHPDLIMGGWKEWDAEIESCMKAVIKASEAFNVPLEINGLGLHKEKIETKEGFRSPYPVKEFWQLVNKSNVKVLCNADAHDPKDVVPFLQDAINFASSVGITPIRDLPNISE